MKKLVCMMCLVFSCIGMVAWAASPVKKTDLRILYVGGSSDWAISPADDLAAYQQSVEERMASFEQLLTTYFTTVKVINATEYNQEMSKEYDVTVMDGTPVPIVPEVNDPVKRIYKRAGYLTDDFNYPMLCIAEASSIIGSRIGSKNDWYCLCLDTDAHSWRKDHVIFKEPYPVKLKTEIKPTPEQALHSAYLIEGGVPKTIAMWKVQTKGYATDEGFRVGLVSRPWGYEDGIDAEYISGGVSQKSLDAVAIGRHGNFFHWGFSASPKYMTEQGKLVFVNAVAYIAKFRGQGIIVRKYNETIPTRIYVETFKKMVGKAGYQEMVDATEEANKMMQGIAEKAKAKQAKGEKLSAEEKAYLNMPPLKVRSREEYMEMYLGPYYKMFGMDEAAYADYFDTNKNWLYVASDGRFLTVDEDVKSLGIPNNELRLLDTAIKMWEENKEVEKAKRILARYTLMDFPRAAEWRYWFEKNKKKLFFTEAGGWIFLVNSREPGVNPYVAWEARKAMSEIPVGETSDREPVAIKAVKEVMQSGEQVLYVKIKVHPGYHIYAYTTSDSPFTPTTVAITLPDGYEAVGNQKVPAGQFYSQGGTTIYDGTVVFSQVIKGKSNGVIRCKVSYQCCDNNICFPPTEKEITVE